MCIYLCARSESCREDDSTNHCKHRCDIVQLSQMAGWDRVALTAHHIFRIALQLRSKLTAVERNPLKVHCLVLIHTCRQSFLF